MQDDEDLDSTDGNCMGREQGDMDQPTDELDGLPIVKKKVPATEALMTVGPYETYYKMNHERRGLALIFNHQKFTIKCKERHGTDEDVMKLKKCLSGLRFEVHVFNNLKFEEIELQIRMATEIDYSNFDCFVLAVLSHGDLNVLYASDQDYNPQDVIFNKFKADNCPTLAGKPKIFILQACRGEAVDDGITLVEHLTEFDDWMPYRIPVKADFLYIYATSKGDFAFRNTETGSYFITVLCEELEKKAHKLHLLDILTIVINRVAVEFESHARDKDYDKKKQIPYFESKLTRFVFFGNSVPSSKFVSTTPTVSSIKKHSS